MRTFCVVVLVLDIRVRVLFVVVVLIFEVVVLNQSLLRTSSSASSIINCVSCVAYLLVRHPGGARSLRCSPIDREITHVLCSRPSRSRTPFLIVDRSPWFWCVCGHSAPSYPQEKLSIYPQPDQPVTVVETSNELERQVGGIREAVQRSTRGALQSVRSGVDRVVNTEHKVESKFAMH